MLRVRLGDGTMSWSFTKQRPHRSAAARSVAAAKVAQLAMDALAGGAFEPMTWDQRRAVVDLIDALDSRARRLRNRR